MKGLIILVKILFQDNGKMMSQPTLKKFGRAFMISGNINLVNDVLKVLHGSGHKIDQVNNQLEAIFYTFCLEIYYITVELS